MQLRSAAIAPLMTWVLIWALSILILGSVSATYWVEKAMEVFQFDFPSKEAYAQAVMGVRWGRWIYWGGLTALTLAGRRSP